MENICSVEHTVNAYMFSKNRGVPNTNHIGLKSTVVLVLTGV